MNFERRMQALERRHGKGDPVTMLQINTVTVDRVSKPHAAFIIGKEGLPGCSVMRAEGESEADFIERAEVEHMRVHGRRSDEYRYDLNQKNDTIKSVS